jgi:hypothetical protein
VEGFTQTFPELSPGVQIGGWAASHVTLHFGHGGGPSTLQEDGLVMFQAGVAVATGVAPDWAAWPFGLVFSPPTAAMGKITHAISTIVTARMLFFIDYFCRFQAVAGTPKPARFRCFLKGSHDSSPRRATQDPTKTPRVSQRMVDIHPFANAE